MDTGHLSSSYGTMQTTYLQTTLPPHTPTCFYCSRRGSLRCLSPSFVCDGEYDCSDRSDERNCTRDGIQRSVVMNGVVVGLLVLFVIAVVGAIVVALLRTFVVIYRHRADRSSSITSTEQECPYVDDHRRPPSYAMTTDIGNAESERLTLPDCVPTIPQEALLAHYVPQEAPPSYDDVCEMQGGCGGVWGGGEGELPDDGVRHEPFPEILTRQ
ncbi:hypothetical protein LSAT2_028387 [Lamellibrachia satsuma]|nr:hypothetical protein LSAT2_028387 [Lamellibrachia satsuma]